MTMAGHPRPYDIEAPRADVPMVGRRGEREVLDRLLEAVRTGQSRALVVDGDPGIGKTVLLDYLVGRAGGCRIVRAAGIQSEAELAFAALHQLCRPLLDRLERLPCPQRDALRAALGLSAAPAPDRFLVGLAVLGLLAEAARKRPLVCVVDDAQWQDSASVQVLAFVARRLGAESVAMVFATRTCNEVAELTGLPQLRVDGLPEPEARTLLRTVRPGPMDERVLDRLVAETRGNPLALLELPRGLTSTELCMRFGLVGDGELPTRIEESYRRRLASLPPETRRLLLVAAAEPMGDPVVLWRAAERLGLDVDAATPAAGLLEIGQRVRFAHPLLRSAILRTASVEERHSAHRALAQATDPEADPDRRAWHAAQAASGPDEDVAAELENSAGRARARGGLAAAGVFLRRAAELSPDPARRAERALVAAQVTHQAGSPDAALRLLSLAEAGPVDALQRARTDLLRARIAFTTGRSDAAQLLLHAATRLEPLDLQLARDTYLEAIWAAWLVTPLTSGDRVRQVAEAARAAPPAPHPPRANDLLLDGFATQLTDGWAAASQTLRRALSALRDAGLPADDGLRWFWLARASAWYLCDDDLWESLASRQLQLARDVGALAVLPHALNAQISVHLLRGELTAAEPLAQEFAAVTEATGSSIVPTGALTLAAWRGREAEADDLMERHRRRAIASGMENFADGIVTGRARALLYNGLGRFEDALTAAQPASAYPPEVRVSFWGPWVEQIEAAARLGTPERAAEAFHGLMELTRASGTGWALGLQARAQALYHDGQAAEPAYREAIDRFSRTRLRSELARSHLLYGEWLRRELRRLEAREQLRVAHDVFTEIGAAGFAERAARELEAAGETVRAQGGEANSTLTAQEAQIARLVSEGLSNPEIAARMFISPRTVEWHLKKIFTKLNITSRTQLRRRAGHRERA
jgi:DNA-binding CsgD family transcriptional regulator